MTDAKYRIVGSRWRPRHGGQDAEVIGRDKDGWPLIRTLDSGDTLSWSPYSWDDDWEFISG